jgi:hypothetical protein
MTITDQCIGIIMPATPGLAGIIATTGTSIGTSSLAMTT